GGVPVREGLIIDRPRQPNRLGTGLMVIHELDLAAARAVVGHATAGRDAGDKLLVEGAADRRARILLHQPLRCIEDAPGGATDILAVDEEAGVALDNLYQRVVDGLDHWHLPLRSAPVAGGPAARSPAP